jgi:hypothetical protein
MSLLSALSLRSASRATALGGEAQAIRSFGGRVPALLTYGVAASRDRFDQLRDRRDENLATGATVPGALPFPTKYFPASEVTELGAYAQVELELRLHHAAQPGP